MKYVLITLLLATSQAFAKYDYCYVGTAKVLKAEPISNNRIRAEIEVLNFQKTYRSKEMKAQKELVKAHKYEGDFTPAPDEPAPKTNDTVHFRAGWDCENGKCTAKSWAFLTEEEAKGQAIVREKVCSPYLH